MDYSNLLKPVTERIGLFSDESSLKYAIKEIGNSKFSIKRSTRGFSLLYNNKVANPVIAGKNKLQIEKILHNIHWRYVKNLARYHLKKENFSLIEEKEKEDLVDLVFSKNEDQQQIIKISCSKKKWEVTFETSGIDNPPSQKYISSLCARIGKSTL